MGQTKKRIFISHTSSEGKIAAALKARLLADFDGVIDKSDVFVSSDLESIEAGENWLTAVKAALKEAKVEIVICSPASVTRPWIHFEAGAGWIRRIRVIPFCHSGIVPEKLPIPFNLLQGVVATESEGFTKLYGSLAGALKIAKPKPDPDFATIVNEMRELEKKLARVTRDPQALPPLLADLYKRVKARGERDIRLHTFLGQDAKPAALGDEATPVDATNVMRLWADAAHDNSIHVTLGKSDGRKLLRIRFTNQKGSLPADVTIRPLGFRAIGVPRQRRFLVMDVRAPASGEGNTGSDMTLAVAVRLIDAQATQWSYAKRDLKKMFSIPVSDDWSNIVVDLHNDWELFRSDGNHRYAGNRPDFSVISAVVIEVGTPGANRPGPGIGEVEVSGLRLCRKVPPE